MIALLLSILLLLLPSRAEAQTSLEECLRTGFARNTGYRQNLLEAESRRNALAARRLAMLPTITATLDEEITWHKNPSFSDVAAAGFSGKVVLFNGLSIQNERISAKLEYNLAPIYLEGKRQDLASSIIEAYIRILLDKEALILAESNCATSLLERDKTQLLVKGGAQPASALAQMEAQLAGDRASVTEARSRTTTDKLALQQLLDLPYSSSFEILPLDEDTEDPPPPLPIDAIDAAVQSNPKTIYAEGMVKSSRAALRAAKGSVSPEIFFTGSYSGTFGAESHRTGAYMGIGVSLPILTSGAVYSRISSAKLSLKAAQLEAYATARNVEAEIGRLAVEAENSYSKLLSCRTNVESLQRLLQINQAKYEKGACSILDYTIAKNNLVKAETGLLEAKWQYIFQRKVLDLYLDRKLLDYEDQEDQYGKDH